MQYPYVGLPLRAHDWYDNDGDGKEDDDDDDDDDAPGWNKQKRGE